MHTAILVIAIAVILLGIAGSFLPVLPGIPLIFAAILGYGFFEGFHKITLVYLIVIGGLTLLSMLVDYLAGVWGARKAGSSRSGVAGAFLGAVAGLFFLPFGILIGPLLGAFAGEYYAKRDSIEAGKAAIGTVTGILGGIVLKVALGAGMLISFLAVAC